MTLGQINLFKTQIVKAVIFVKLNTHDHTPRPEKNKTITFLFVLCTILMYTIYGLVAFAYFYYAHSFVVGISVIFIPVFLTAIILIQIKDIEKAYIEIKETEIYVFDYYFGIKKEKRILFSDITFAEIHPSYSHKVKGYHVNALGMRYIVFKKGKKIYSKFPIFLKYNNYLRSIFYKQNTKHSISQTH